MVRAELLHRLRRGVYPPPVVEPDVSVPPGGAEHVLVRRVGVDRVDGDLARGVGPVLVLLLDHESGRLVLADVELNSKRNNYKWMWES